MLLQRLQEAHNSNVQEMKHKTGVQRGLKVRACKASSSESPSPAVTAPDAPECSARDTHLLLLGQQHTHAMLVSYVCSDRRRDCCQSSHRQGAGAGGQAGQGGKAQL
jgi:hypothetical protein